MMFVGNLWEWTTETSYVDNMDYNLNSTLNTYMLRGGRFGNKHADHPASFRTYEAALSSDTGYGFRIALYLQ